MRQSTRTISAGVLSLLDHKGRKKRTKRKERKGGKKKRWERNRERERVREVREGWEAVLLLVVVVDGESGHVHCSALILDPACRFVLSIGGSGADPRAIFPRLSSSRVCVRKKASRSRREGGGPPPRGPRR